MPGQIPQPIGVHTVEIARVDAAVRFHDDLHLAFAADPAGGGQPKGKVADQIVQKADASVDALLIIGKPKAKDRIIECGKPFRRKHIRALLRPLQFAKAGRKLDIPQIQLRDALPHALRVPRDGAGQGAQHVVLHAILPEQPDGLFHPVGRPAPARVHARSIVQVMQDII